MNPLLAGSHRPTGSRQGLRRKQGLAAIAIVVLVTAAVYLLARGKGFDWRVLIETVSGLDLGWLGAALLAAHLTYVVRAVRWAVLIEPLRARPRLGKLFSATVIGYSTVTALGRPAEMVRPYLIANREQVPFSSQAAAWIVERIYDCLFSLAVFGFAVSEVSGSGVHTGPALEWALRAAGAVIALGAAAGLGLLLAMKYRSEQIHRWMLRMLGFLGRHHFQKAERMLAGFVNGVQCTRSGSATLRLICYTCLEWALVGACYACVLKAFGDIVPATPAGVAILMGFVSFGSLVQLPAIGGGMQVTAVLVLTQIFGVPFEAATGIGFVLWFVLFAAILPAGIVLALQEGLSWASISEAERGAA